MEEMDELGLLSDDIHKAEMSKEQAVWKEITVWQKIQLVRLVLTLTIINDPRNYWSCACDISQCRNNYRVNYAWNVFVHYQLQTWNKQSSKRQT